MSPARWNTVPFVSDVSDALPAKVFYLSMAYTGQKSYACSDHVDGHGI